MHSSFLRRCARAFFVLGVAASVGARHAGAAPCTFQHVDIPLTRQGDRIVVEARLNDVPVKLKLHIGSTLSLIWPATIERIGLKPTRQDRPYRATAGGAPITLSRLGRTARFAVGSLSFTDASLFISQPLGNDAAEVDGMLGWDVFSGFDVYIDVKAATLGVYQAKGDCSDPAAALSGELTSLEFHRRDELNGQPRFAIAIAGHAYEAELSTVSAQSLVRRSIAADLKLTGADAAAANLKVKLQGVSIGALAISNLPARVADDLPADVILGLSFLNAVPVWLSNSSQRLISKLPPQ